MRIKTYVLVVSVVLLTMSAATKDTRSVTGINPGDLAPRIEFTGSEEFFNSQSHSKKYMLLQFWAAYDAESRARNVQLSNEISRLNSESISFYSVSMDENESIFRETIKIDKLDESTQFREQLGKSSPLYKTFKLGKGLRNFLINPEGIIVATDVSPLQLEEILRRN